MVGATDEIGQGFMGECRHPGGSENCDFGRFLPSTAAAPTIFIAAAVATRQGCQVDFGVAADTLKA